MANTKTLRIERIFDAPRELVWKAFTNEEMIKKWWGPKDFTAPHANLNPRVGEKYLLSMKGPEGSEYDKEMWSTGVYKEVVENEKLVMTDSFADEHGNVVPATFYGMGEGFPLELLITVTFEDYYDGPTPQGSDEASKTKVILVHEGFPADQDVLAEQGWNEQLDKLVGVLAEGEALKT